MGKETKTGPQGQIPVPAKPVSVVKSSDTAKRDGVVDTRKDNSRG